MKSLDTLPVKTGEQNKAGSKQISVMYNSRGLRPGDREGHNTIHCIPLVAWIYVVSLRYSYVYTKRPYDWMISFPRRPNTCLQTNYGNPENSRSWATLTIQTDMKNRMKLTSITLIRMRILCLWDRASSL